MIETVSTVEAARLAGVTVRQLTHWADAGYLRPMRTKGDKLGGHAGVRLRWDARDIDAAARFGALSAALGLGNGGVGVLRTFASALAVPYGEAVGVLVEAGRFTVSVEVRANGCDAGANGKGR